MPSRRSHDGSAGLAGTARQPTVSARAIGCAAIGLTFLLGFDGGYTGHLASHTGYLGCHHGHQPHCNCGSAGIVTRLAGGVSKSSELLGGLWTVMLPSTVGAPSATKSEATGNLRKT